MLLGPIYALTDPLLLPGERLFTAVEAALRCGVKTVQLRDKATSDSELIAMAERLVSLCNLFSAKCIINDRVEVALATGAHGVHLGQTDGSVSEARRRLGDKAVIGVTCHASLELARRAVAEGAGYLAFGRFFASRTKPLATPADPQILRQAAAEFALPIVAIGGIERDNMGPLLQAGAQTAAVCQSLFGNDQVEQNALDLLAEYRKYQAHPALS